MRRFQVTSNNFRTSTTSLRTKAHQVVGQTNPVVQYYYNQQQQQNQFPHLPPLLREAVAASPSQYQQLFMQQQQQHRGSHLQQQPMVLNQQQNMNSSAADQLHDSLQAEQQKFHTKGFRALHKHHRNFVFCCIVVALLVPDMFDNHLGETMRYQLLMRDPNNIISIVSAEKTEEKKKGGEKK
jgi:hypothetical protein